MLFILLSLIIKRCLVYLTINNIIISDNNINNNINNNTKILNIQGGVDIYLLLLSILS